MKRTVTCTQGRAAAGVAEGECLNARVLVVDDEHAFRLLAEAALSSDGFEVRTTGTLQEAEEEIATWSPDVLLLNRSLPDGDGVHFLKTIDASSASPIVVMVGRRPNGYRGRLRLRFRTSRLKSRTSPARRSVIDAIIQQCCKIETLYGGTGRR